MVMSTAAARAVGPAIWGAQHVGITVALQRTQRPVHRGQPDPVTRCPQLRMQVLGADELPVR